MPACVNGLVPDAKVRKSNQVFPQGIGVLIDLSGHAAHNRMGVFARRAATVQAHYLCYFTSTGLSEKDYFFCDACRPE